MGEGERRGGGRGEELLQLDSGAWSPISNCASGPLRRDWESFWRAPTGRINPPAVRTRRAAASQSPPQSPHHPPRL